MVCGVCNHNCFKDNIKFMCCLKYTSLDCCQFHKGKQLTLLTICLSVHLSRYSSQVRDQSKVNLDTQSLSWLCHGTKWYKRNQNMSQKFEWDFLNLKWIKQCSKVINKEQPRVDQHYQVIWAWTSEGSDATKYQSNNTGF